MSTLDQAFIKAYTQHGATAASPASAPRAMPLANALVEHERERRQGRAKASLDGVLAALQHQPKGPVEPPPKPASAPPEPEIEPDAVGAEWFLPPMLRKKEAAEPEPAAPEPSDPAKPVATLADFGIKDRVYRVDRPAVAAEAVSEPQSVPPPHVGGGGAEPQAAVAAAESALAATESAVAAAVESETSFDASGAELDAYSVPAAPPAVPPAVAGRPFRLAAGVEPFGRGRQGANRPVLRGVHRGQSPRTEGAGDCRLPGRRGRIDIVVLRGAAIVRTRPAHRHDRRRSARSATGAAVRFADRLRLGGRADGTVAAGRSGRRSGRPAVGPASTVQSAERRGALPDNPTAAAECIATLAAEYDLVLVDLGPLERAAGGKAIPCGIGEHVDAAVLVQDMRATSTERLVEVQRNLRAAGIAHAGVVRNLVQP